MARKEQYRKNPEYYSNWAKHNYRTPIGKLKALYSGAQSRVRGQIAPKWRKYYEGLPIASREEFFSWALSEDSSYMTFFQKWEESNFSHELSPSLDRIDPLKGYVIDNLQWLTWQENKDRKRTRPSLRDDQVIEIRRRYTKPSGRGKFSPNSTNSLAKEFSVTQATIHNIIAGKTYRHLIEKVGI